MCRTSIYLALALLISLKTAIGCGSNSNANAPMPTQGTATDAGEVFNLADFSITLPPELVAVDVPGETFEEGMNELRGKLDQSQTRKLEGQLEMLRQNGFMKLMAADIANGDVEFVDNVNVLVQPLAARVPQSMILEANLKQVADMNIEVVSQDSVTVNGHSFDRLHCRASFMAHEWVSYLAMVDKKSYTFTFAARKERSAAFFELGEKVMQTVQLK